MTQSEAGDVSVQESPSEVFEKIVDVPMGHTSEGDIVKTIGRRDGEVEVHYGFAGTNVQIAGRSYEANGEPLFYIAHILGMSEGGINNITKISQLFQTLERDCMQQGVRALTTLCIPQLANVICKRYGFNYSSEADKIAMVGTNRRSAYQTGAIPLYKMLPVSK